MFGLFSKKQKVVTRFAPSPTGLLHTGNYRTAIFSYLYAKHHGGSYILRIEDTDKDRSKKEYEDNIFESLAWLGLTHDAFFRQSDRGDIHRAHLQKLLDSGAAYVSKEEVKEGSRGEVIRFKNPGTKVTFTDLIRGDITFDTTELGDFVIAKSAGEPLFHFAVVVDDFTMGVTHIVRGDDHISNTPRQILIQRALGAPQPFYAHLPLILGADRSKLSKRKGAKALTEYRDAGYLPQALFNYLALLGWHPTSDKELFSKEELVKEFDLSRVQKGGAIFDEEKLLWFNREHLMRLSDEEFDKKLKAFLPNTSLNLSIYRKLLRERSATFSEAAKFLVDGEFSYLEEAPNVDAGKLVWKKDTPQMTATHLSKAIQLMEQLPPEPSIDEAKKILLPYAEEVGKGSVLWPVRFALSGREKSPDPFELISLLGKDAVMARLRTALALLSK